MITKVETTTICNTFRTQMSTYKQNPSYNKIPARDQSIIFDIHLHGEKQWTCRGVIDSVLLQSTLFRWLSSIRKPVKNITRKHHHIYSSFVPVRPNVHLEVQLPSWQEWMTIVCPAELVLSSGNETDRIDLNTEETYLFTEFMIVCVPTAGRILYVSPFKGS